MKSHDIIVRAEAVEVALVRVSRTRPLAPRRSSLIAITFPTTEGPPGPTSSNPESSLWGITMAETPGVSEADLKAKILDQLQAIYVEIEDMSGPSPSNLFFTPPSRSKLTYFQVDAVKHFPR